MRCDHQPRRLGRWPAGLAALAWLAGPALANEGEGGGIYPGDLGQAIASLLIFAGLLAILGRYAWKPILLQLKRREESIAKTLADSQQREQKAQELLAKYAARLDGAASEAAEVIAKARREAAAAGEDLLAHARQEAQTFLVHARQDLQQAKQAALQELYASTAELSTQVAAQVLGKVLDAHEQQRLLDQSLQEISQAFAKGP
jgi:F-type H+-transporting ATPase subunit b